MARSDFQRAVTLLDEGDAAAAAALLVRVADTAPMQASAQVVLARALESAGRNEEACEAWRNAFFLMPNSPLVGEALQAALSRKIDLETQAAQEFQPEAQQEPATEPFTRPFTDPLPSPEPATEPVRDPEPFREPETEPFREPEPFPDPERPPVHPPRPEPEPGTEPFRPPEPRREPGTEPTPDPSPRPEPDTPAPEPIPTEPGREESLEASEEEDLPDVQPGFRDIEDERFRNQGEPPLDISPGHITDDGDLDLDRLIAELEGARIVPGPHLEDLPPQEPEDDSDDIVTETLARIYAAQQQYDESARIYELLAARHPDRSAEFRALADEMRTRAAD
jgi:tetratricopeptide (TPR) repeat protein